MNKDMRDIVSRQKIDIEYAAASARIAPTVIFTLGAFGLPAQTIISFVAVSFNSG